MRTITARKRRGVRRALPAAILTVALAAAGVPVVATLTAQPASAAAVGSSSSSTSGAPVYANGTGTSPNQDKVAWLSWGADRAAISMDPSAVRTVTNSHQISDTERVEVTCQLTPKQDVIYSSTFDTFPSPSWAKFDSYGAVVLSQVNDPDASRTGKSLLMSGIKNGQDTAALDLLTTPGVTKGSTYTISFKARLASPTPAAMAHFTVYSNPGAAYKWVGNETPVSSTAWTTITGTYTLPADATEARMYVNPTNVGAFPFNMLIDDVTILKTSTVAVDSYKSTYAGSALPRMYGGLGPVGIRQIDAFSTVSFSVACAGKLVEYDAGGTVVVGTPRTVDIGGLVFADAESSRTGEYVTATPQGSFGSSPWRQIDQHHGSCDMQDGYARAQLAGSTWELRLDNPTRQCTTGGTPNAVMLASGVNALDLTIHGEGQSAAAVGYILATDYGDAPSSFGAAGALLRPTWAGQMLGAGTTNLAGFLGTGTTCAWFGGTEWGCNGPYVKQNGLLSTAASPALSLGATAALNTSVPSDATATADTPDENAFGAGQPPLIDARPGTAATSVVSTATCRGGAAHVAGWLDWNGNGTFETGERSNIQPCPAGGTPTAVTLTWPSPASVSPPAGGTSFLRLRVSTDQNDLATATRASINGEVEDWKVTVRAPQVSVTKTANVTSVPGSGQPVGYTVKLTNIGTLDFTSTYKAYLVDDVAAAIDDATLGTVTVVGGAASTLVGNRVEWSGPLVAGQSVTLTYNMVVRGTPADRIMTNIVQASPTALGSPITCVVPGAEATAKRCARVDLWAVGMTVTKRAYDTGGAQLSNGAVLRPATIVRWDYVVKNTGSAPLSNITVKDDWSETRTRAGSTVPTSGSTVITCPGHALGTPDVIPTLAAGQSLTCTATRTVVPDS